MTWHPVKQNTEEPCPCCGKTWQNLRSGKVTGSSIARVMAHHDKPLKNGFPKFGDPARNLAIDIAVVELGGSVQGSNYKNADMERGHAEEPIARSLYESETFCTVKNGGFFDNGRTGCSPDGIVDNGLIEIKSVINHVQHNTINRGDIDPSYKWQVAFNLKESKLDWIDYISFCNTYYNNDRLFVIRKTKDDLVSTFQAIDLRLIEFFRLVDYIKDDMKKRISNA
jgi:uncharacterized protein YkuJ